MEEVEGCKMISKKVESISYTSFLGFIFNHELLSAPLVILHLSIHPFLKTLPHICWSNVLCFKLWERDRLYTKSGERGEKIGFSSYRNVVNTFTQSDQGKPKKPVTGSNPSWDLNHLLFIHRRPWPNIMLFDHKRRRRKFAHIKQAWFKYKRKPGFIY